MPTGVRFLSARRTVLLAVLFTLAAAPATAHATPIALGVNIANAPGYMAPMQSYASLAGGNPAIVMWYQEWSEPLFYSTQLPNTESMGGALPMITWDPYENGVGIPLSDIVAGDYDSYIKDSADAAAAWGKPIYIRFGHEMNLSGSGFEGGIPGDTPAEFVAAWRHVVTIFRQEGATNVEWVWSPNESCDGSCPFDAYYPGDSWVDWVALDGYNYSSVDDMPWMSFDQIFDSSYDDLASLTSKPMMIAETASAPVGGNKGLWITQTFSELPIVYPRIHAVIWFDRDKETNWMVNSSPSSLAAWRAVVRNPLYAGKPTYLLSLAPLRTDADSAGKVTSRVSTGTSTQPPKPTRTSKPSPKRRRRNRRPLRHRNRRHRHRPQVRRHHRSARDRRRHHSA
jgi:hypothetical protein